MPEDTTTPDEGNKTDRFASVYDLNDGEPEAVALHSDTVDGAVIRVLSWTGYIDKPLPFVRFGGHTYKVFDIQGCPMSGSSTVLAVNLDG